MEKHQISVTGLGYVGLPVSVAFNEAGYNVIGLDLNEESKKNLTLILIKQMKLVEIDYQNAILTSL